MKVILGANNTISSYAIRLHNFSKWSHCAVLVNDKIIEAVSDEGVRISTLDEFKKKYNKWKIIEIPHKGDFQKRLLDQVGKPYDSGAIWKFVLRGDWSDPDKWFCYELAAYASGVLNSKYLDRVTATHLLMISEGKD